MSREVKHVNRNKLAYICRQFCFSNVQCKKLEYMIICSRDLNSTSVTVKLYIKHMFYTYYTF